MTVAELTFLLERLAKAGCTAEQLVAAAKAARDWRVEQKALAAVKRALFPRETRSQAEQVSPGEGAAKPDSESVFSGQHPDSRKAVARKALLTSRRLRPCARQVGAALVERFNLSTGRCDASVGRLAEDAGYDLRSARRAIRELEAAGLFTRAVQAGRGHANSYAPMWDALGALARDAEPTKADSQNRTLDAKPDGRVRQNHKRDKHPLSVGGGRHRARVPEGQLSLRMFGEIEGGRAALDARRRKALVAVELALRGKYRAEAERRALLGGFAALDRVMLDIIADAELAERGKGIRTFEEWLRAQGPPKAAGAG